MEKIHTTASFVFSIIYQKTHLNSTEILRLTMRMTLSKIRLHVGGSLDSNGHFESEYPRYILDISSGANLFRHT